MVPAPSPLGGGAAVGPGQREAAFAVAGEAWGAVRRGAVPSPSLHPPSLAGKALAVFKAWSLVAALAPPALHTEPQEGRVLRLPIPWSPPAPFTVIMFSRLNYPVACQDFTLCRAEEHSTVPFLLFYFFPSPL